MFLNSKKTFTLLASLLFALVFVGTSCKKDDEKTTEDYLAAHDWKWTSIKLNESETLDPCQFDDILTFHKDGTYHEDAGAEKCNVADSQEISGTWSVSTTTTPETLTVGYTDQSIEYKFEYKVTSINDDKAELTITVQGFGTFNTILEKK